MFCGLRGIISMLVQKGNDAVKESGENLRRKELLYDLILILAGNAVLAIGVGVFILPANILSGGVAGIAVALEPFLHINPNVMINFLTVGLFLLGSLFLGKKFALHTVLSTMFYPLFLGVVTYFTQEQSVSESPLLNSIYAGVFVGIGVGLVFRSGASSGGMDIPPLIINKYTGIPLPTLVLITDGLTVCLGILAYDLEAALIGLVSVYVSSMMIDKVITIGGHDAKNVMIISNHYEAITSSIYTNLNRGATIIEATGGYTQTKRPMIMVVLSKKQLPALKRMIAHIDPEAFVVVSETTEVQGEGFSYQEEM